MDRPRIISDADQMLAWSRNAQQQGHRVALVPTMGFLHAGHLSLVRRARACADRVVVSIFVNPTQFGPKEDLARYPRDMDGDLEKLAPLEVDVVFQPDPAVVYPPGFDTYVVPDQLAQGLCGTARPTHFRGVATVVLILFRITACNLAVFGQKDFQQLQIVRRMVRDLRLDVQIEAGPIIREPDGLAMSSRNAYLSPEQRAAATVLSRCLDQLAAAVSRGERDATTLRERARATLAREPLGRVEYVEIVDPETLRPVNTITGPVICLLAVHFGKTRLIDNRRLTS